MKICKICGNQLENYASFCTNCGSLVDNAQPQQPVEENNFYAQPETVAEELPEAEVIVIDEASTEAFAKAAKSAKIMSIVAISVSGVLLCFAGLASIMAFFLSFFNYLSFIATGPLAIASIVFIILYLLNIKKVKPLLGVDLSTVDPAYYEICEKAVKGAKLAKTLGLVSIILFAISALGLLFVIVWPLLLLLIVGGGAILSEIL